MLAHCYRFPIDSCYQSSENGLVQISKLFDRSLFDSTAHHQLHYNLPNKAVQPEKNYTSLNDILSYR
jgi:hypothetical protein